ncbi:hypothetical protein BDFB_001807, partial [Asbolus verrucosus]
YRILIQISPTSYEIADPKRPTENLGKYHAPTLKPFIGPMDSLEVPIVPIHRRGCPRKHKPVQNQ